MRQSKAEIYLHFVWATWHREGFLTPELERPVHRCIEQEARRLLCEVLAVGGMADHVHLLVKVSPTLAASKIMHQVKGISSHFVQERFSESFAWQEGYGVFSVGPNQVARVCAYVENQKQHHTEGTTHPKWEETDEEYRPRSGGASSPPSAGRLALRPPDG